LCALSNDPFKPTYYFLDNSIWQNTAQLPSADMSHATDIPDGNLPKTSTVLAMMVILLLRGLQQPTLAEDIP